MTRSQYYSTAQLPRVLKQMKGYKNMQSKKTGQDLSIVKFGLFNSPRPDKCI